MLYLKNNHPHLKEAQTAENPADDRRSAQRCWAKVCREVSVGVRPKTGGKKHDCLKYQQLLPFSLASSPKTYRGEGHPVSAVVQLGAGAKSFHLPSWAVSALIIGWLAFCCSRLPICAHDYAHAAYLDVIAYLFIS